MQQPRKMYDPTLVELYRTTNIRRSPMLETLDYGITLVIALIAIGWFISLFRKKGE